MKPEALVYAETPFMQQGHGGPYDYTRFTNQGHRRLFRNFRELDSGAVAGPGMALACSYECFLVALVKGKSAQRVARLFASLTAWHLKYFDYLIIDRPAARDAASGLYFMGEKADHALTDRELLAKYDGAI